MLYWNCTGLNDVLSCVTYAWVSRVNSRLIFYLFHLKPLGELWDLLIQPVRRTELGEWDPEDLEERTRKTAIQLQLPPSRYLKFR